MNGDRAVELAFLVLAITLPLSALLTRRMPAGRTARLVLLWIAIIVAATLTIDLLRTRSTHTPASSTLHNIYYRDA